MYDFLLKRFGDRVAFWCTAFWYAGLMVLVTLAFAAPAGEFRYGNL